jgi:hypothetical protein
MFNCRRVEFKARPRASASMEACEFVEQLLISRDVNVLFSPSAPERASKSTSSRIAVERDSDDAEVVGDHVEKCRALRQPRHCEVG